MIDTLITHMHSKRVLYVHVCYLLLSVDFTVSFQHAAANNTHVFKFFIGRAKGGVSALLFTMGKHAPQIKRLVTSNSGNIYSSG